ncbi:hypothetical protein [uncultured Shewanella sp.]|uniref:hypothetical protein n=1 Tax=uncultured Shewanella sp. TaxID=173975 RepID=UPI002618E197|nr:hypothetical protein [uncultured Shewanella sp.]
MQYLINGRQKINARLPQDIDRVSEYKQSITTSLIMFPMAELALSLMDSLTTHKPLSNHINNTHYP